jgi:anti-sigma B factor antagonist
MPARAGDGQADMQFETPQFDLSEEEIDERTTVVAVRGEIHVTTAPAFSERLSDVIAKGKTSLILDLSGVDFIDSTGLSVLLNGLRSVTNADGRMALACSNPTVLRLFEITKLDSTFDIRPTREEAIASVRGEAAA